jgi:hypothetical protein
MRKIACLVAGAAGLSAILTFRSAGQTPPDAALISKARGIHNRVIKLDTHNDIEPDLFTPDCNASRLARSRERFKTTAKEVAVSRINVSGVSGYRR